MKPTNEREIDKHGSFRIPARLVVFFIVVVFALSLKYWAGAYSGAKHEIGATFDAKGVSSFALKDDGGRDVATFPVYYKDAVCD